MCIYIYRYVYIYICIYIYMYMQIYWNGDLTILIVIWPMIFHVKIWLVFLWYFDVDFFGNPLPKNQKIEDISGVAWNWSGNGSVRRPGKKKQSFWWPLDFVATKTLDFVCFKESISILVGFYFSYFYGDGFLLRMSGQLWICWQWIAIVHHGEPWVFQKDTLW